ncbi:hypothetical protein Tco_0725040 [Tanacetum coccineum]|uniref:Polyprotein n=1 Tax=Tanacetum coccineum TaxID=301880 RepID=A0ABQ4YBR0_9ASTR
MDSEIAILLEDIHEDTTVGRSNTYSTNKKLKVIKKFAKAHALRFLKLLKMKAEVDAMQEEIVCSLRFKRFGSSGFALCGYKANRYKMVVCTEIRRMQVGEVNDWLLRRETHYLAMHKLSQSIVATSKQKPEYVCLLQCAPVASFMDSIQKLFSNLGFNFMNTKIYIDTESTICIIKNPVYHSKTKHIAIRHHFIRDAYEKKLIQESMRMMFTDGARIVPVPSVFHSSLGQKFVTQNLWTKVSTASAKFVNAMSSWVMNIPPKPLFTLRTRSLSSKQNGAALESCPKHQHDRILGKDCIGLASARAFITSSFDLVSSDRIQGKRKHFSGKGYTCCVILCWLQPYSGMRVLPLNDYLLLRIFGATQPEPSPDPSPKTITHPIVPDSIPKPTGEILEIIHPVSDQAKEIKLLKAKINKLKKQAKPVIKHHKEYLKSVSLQQRFPRKSFSKKHRVHTKNDALIPIETEERSIEGRRGQRSGGWKTRRLMSCCLSTEVEFVSTDKEGSQCEEHFEGSESKSSFDPQDKGKKKIEEEDESESEDDDIPQAVKKFKQLVVKELTGRKNSLLRTCKSKKRAYSTIEERAKVPSWYLLCSEENSLASTKIIRPSETDLQPRIN